ncbi:peptidase M24 [Calothrix sp. NIES-4071]|nr:peptidase M24 [Calothrix sp. NIES-4071]BAZ59839.1 peptidase M24 [Calothrix sp. NIES-4105]
MNKYSDEVSTKLEFIRQTLEETGAQGVHLSGTDWFAWITAGASNTVLLTAETGIASVLVTTEDAWVLTDEIEAQRLQDEELPPNFKLHINPWADTAARESFICNATGDGKVLSDRPVETQKPLPTSLQQYKRVMMPSELERYREVGRKASVAMTEVLLAAKPTWTEYQLAGAGAEALWARGLHPALTLVAGERRLPLYRHATPANEPIGSKAMMVFCARGYGLYANLTRFVSFGTVPNKENELHRICREVESVALNMCKPGTALNEVYQALAKAYQQHGFANAIREHHQGGTTGYLAREIVANPTTTDTLTENMAVAWNPSLAGAKIEDTFIITGDGKLENLTFDASFPNIEVEGRLRPIVLEV